MRIVLYSGKGGVGKTTVAAATAVRCADLGQRTLIMSTDVGGSLSDLFNVTIGVEPTPAADRLWAQETRHNASVGRQWDTIRDWLAGLLAQSDIQEILADEIAVLPGMDEVANLSDLVRYAGSQDYDTIIVDCAPTGETLRLLSLPDILAWWLRKISAHNGTVSLKRHLLKPLLEDLAISEDVVQSAGRIMRQLAAMRAILTNPRTTSVRLVLNPERMAIRETQRSLTYLNLYGYLTDLIVCNRCLPARVGGYFTQWKGIQEAHLKEIREGFASVPVVKASLMDREITGLAMLRSLAGEMYDGARPTDFFSRRRAFKLGKEDGHYVLSLELPDATKEDISLMRSDDELTVNVGSYRRNIILPQTLARSQVSSAKFEGGRLVVKFRSRKKGDRSVEEPPGGHDDAEG